MNNKYLCKMIIKRISSYVSCFPYIYIIRKYGKYSCFGKGLQINGGISQKIEIGDYVEVGRYARIGNTRDGIIIGNGCWIGNYFTALGNRIVIDNNCLFGSYVSLIADNHNLNPEDTGGYASSHNQTGEIIIGRGCWIGDKATVLSGVHIGKYSVVGAASVVTKDVQDYTIVVGNPARPIKRYNLQSHHWENIYE